jgi:futalosine hydrolase
MEGAAVYYVCLQEGVPFVEIRTVSNAVGESDSSKWQTSLALNSLLQVCKEILDIYC